jgi:DNA uptake protein ComE-like DNA-binding protein
MTTFPFLYPAGINSHFKRERKIVMSWKDYFYFQKRDRTAILLLLVLIVLSGIVYILTRPQKQNESSVPVFSQAPAPTLPGKTERGDSAVAKIQAYAYPHQDKLKAGQTIELNAADTSDLKKIPGIGTSYSNRIVKYKTLLGGYAYIGQLREVYGLDDELYNKIRPYLTIVPQVKKIRINHADFKELNRHPYIDYKQTRAIIDIRTRKGTIESINRLSLLDEFTAEDIKRLTPYLSFD